MLPPHDLELLTGYADGELTAPERRRAERLLAESEEARALLQQLLADGQALRALSRPVAPVDFSESVLAAIHRDGVRLVRRPRPPVACRPFTSSRWLGLAAAAAVLLLIGLGSFLLHLGQEAADDAGPVARQPAGSPDRPLPAPGGDAGGAREIVRAPSPSPAPAAERVGPPKVHPPLPDRPDEAVLPRLPAERAPDAGPVLGAAGGELVRGFDRVELALPQVFRLHDLDAAEQAGLLGKQLGRGSAHRVELLARDATRGHDRLRAALARHKIELLHDPAAAVRLKKPGWKTDYGVFVENVTPSEAVALLRGVGVADRQAGRKMPSEQRFDGPLVVKPIARADRRELHDLLGVDVIAVRPVVSLIRPEVDLHRSLTDLTREAVQATLEGRGVPRPGAEASARVGYVLPLSGPRSRPVELKRFLETRRPAQPDTLQLFLVLRNLG